MTQQDPRQNFRARRLLLRRGAVLRGRLRARPRGAAGRVPRGHIVFLTNEFGEPGSATAIHVGDNDILCRVHRPARICAARSQLHDNTQQAEGDEIMIKGEINIHAEL